MMVIGSRFGQLMVTGGAPSKSSGALCSTCQCDCGRISVVADSQLRTGKTRSCGCLQRRISAEGAAHRNFKHGFAREGKRRSEYRIWAQMINRCRDKRRMRYGGRGILVCERWASSFESFLADVGPRPGPEFSIDRINNDGNYEPGNIRWATDKIQSSNSCNVIHLTVRGTTRLISEWSTETGLTPNTLRRRLRDGWTSEDVVSRPLRRCRRQTSQHDKRAVDQ